MTRSQLLGTIADEIDVAPDHMRAKLLKIVREQAKRLARDAA
ncbi:hypothetical protein [Azospirillum thiophilum]|nr:hypothetical protein [Azospirillum thiophilum]